MLQYITYKHVYLYDCRFRDECVCVHHVHHSLRHHGLLHARHVETVHVVPECNAFIVFLCVSDCCQADVTKVWIDCGENRGAKEVEDCSKHT